MPKYIKQQGYQMKITTKQRSNEATKQNSKSEWIQNEKLTNKEAARCKLWNLEAKSQTKMAKEALSEIKIAKSGNKIQT